jgi:hypothetical protein
MSRTAPTASVLEQRHHRPVSARATMTAAFLVAVVVAVVMLAIFGTGEHGTAIALRATARWSFLLFWLAYVGSAMAKLFGSRFNRFAQRGRDFGLAFASAQLIHISLVLWQFYLSARSSDLMLVFWAGIAFTYLLALLSWTRLREMLGSRAWHVLRTVAMEYIAYVFAVDFILIQLDEHGAAGYPLSYVPFAVLLVGGFCLRVIAAARSRQSPRWRAA